MYLYIYYNLYNNCIIIYLGFIISYYTGTELIFTYTHT